MCQKLSSYREAMEMAYVQAELSPDQSNQNGAVLLRDGFEVAQVGFNGYTRGFTPTPEQTERPRKYNFIVHAEQRAVSGIDATDMTLVCPWAACTKCAQCIIESGVTKIVTHDERMLTTPERWLQEIKDADSMLLMAGVEITSIKGKFDLDFTIKVNGEDWRP